MQEIITVIKQKVRVTLIKLMTGEDKLIDNKRLVRHSAELLGCSMTILSSPTGRKTGNIHSHGNYVMMEAYIEANKARGSGFTWTQRQASQML